MSNLANFEEEFGNAGRALSRLIRPIIAAPKGRTLVWGDWSAIEACVLPWLADSRGSRAVLDTISASYEDPNAPDLYCRAAGDIEHCPPEKVWEAYSSGDKWGKSARQTGKVAVLALGFGGAVGALQSMAVGYGISLTEAEAKEIVDAWRAGNGWARGFWDKLWKAFLHAMENPDTPVAVGRVVYMYDKGYLGGTMLCFLPDGRPLVYSQLRWKKMKREDREGKVTEKMELTYRRGYTRRSLWYGVLAENVTQATAGSLLREAIQKLEPAVALEYGSAEAQIGGLNDAAFLCGHTHDEIIAECADTEVNVAATRADLERAMLNLPEWAEGLPIAAEITDNWYYTKTIG